MDKDKLPFPLGIGEPPLFPKLVPKDAPKPAEPQPAPTTQSAGEAIQAGIRASFNTPKRMS